MTPGACPATAPATRLRATVCAADVQMRKIIGVKNRVLSTGFLFGFFVVAFFVIHGKNISDTGPVFLFRFFDQN